MDRDDTTERALAVKIAAGGWGLHDELSAIQGQARQTWRIADHWLSAVDDRRFEALQRERRLLQELQCECSRSEIGIQVPEPVSTDDGRYEVHFEGRAWRVTKHLQGFRPNDDLAVTFVEASSALVKVHRALRSLPEELAVGDSAIAGLRPMLDQAFRRDWEPLTDDPQERELVEGVAQFVVPLLERLESEPVQLIHGDWATPNLLVSDPSTGAVTGVLDWEFCTVGPIVADLATLASTVLMWSRLPAKPRLIQSIADAYGGDLEPDLLSAAIAAKWFRNYWWARADLERTGWDSAVAVMSRQPGRLRSTFAYCASLRGG
jgi:Ser/Thr protein kinase RdoA (MazF antagonist)